MSLCCLCFAHQSITLGTSFHGLIDQARCNFSQVAGNETETHREDLWPLKSNLHSSHFWGGARQAAAQEASLGPQRNQA